MGNKGKRRFCKEPKKWIDRLVQVQCLLGLSLWYGCLPVTLGPVGHDPNRLYRLPCSDLVPFRVDHPEQRSVVVLKRFQNFYPNPIGANYMVSGDSNCEEKDDELTSGSISQIYSASDDLAATLFEETFNWLRMSGYRVWKDYMPSSTIIQGPPQVDDYVVLSGVVSYLELDTFSSSDINEAVAVRIEFSSYDPDGRELEKWTVTSEAKILRGENTDVLHSLAQKIGLELAQTIDSGRLQ
jgi:hypothetical protein